MIFGNKATFAIETMLEPFPATETSVWGRMQLWCRNEAIGDFSVEHSALYPSYIGFKALSERLSRLWHPDFAGLSDPALWQKLHALVFDDETAPLLAPFNGRPPLRAADIYREFSVLSNWGVQFDGLGFCYLVCTPAREVRILSLYLTGEGARAAHAPLDDVLAATHGYLRWFERQSEALEVAS
jgi:hypothetical protein